MRSQRTRVARFRGTLDKSPLVAVAAPDLAVCSVRLGTRFALPPLFFVVIAAFPRAGYGVIVVTFGR